MAPTLRSAHEPSTPTTRSISASMRTFRAKSLPTLDFISAERSPKKITPFELGAIIPSSAAICKACKMPIVKSPSPPLTPKLTRPARSILEAQLQSSLLQAHGRAVNIQAAYASASREFNILGNNDVTTEKQELDVENLPSEWRHVPYTAKVCTMVGTLYGELGRALATSQMGINALDALLDEERIMLQANDQEEQRKLRRAYENVWFQRQKADRIEAAKPKKRKRNKNR